MIFLKGNCLDWPLPSLSGKKDLLKSIYNVHIYCIILGVQDSIHGALFPIHSLDPHNNLLRYI